MIMKSVLPALGVFVFLAGPSHALTLINEDDATHSIEVILGEGDGGQKQHQLSSGEALSDICPQGCIIRLGDGIENKFSGDEEVIIEDGNLIILE